MNKEELMALVKKHAQLDAEEVLRAYETAERAHAEQKRDGGEPYITHPAAVAGLLVGIGMDTPTIIAALLHDVVEDTTMTLDDVRKIFGEEVAFFVEGVTRLERLPSASTRTDESHMEEAQAALERTGGFSVQDKEQAARYARTMTEALRKRSEDISARAETLRKMFLATAQDIRVALIKLADRLHNMRTLGACAPEKRVRISQETMDIYAPLASRLGMGEWKGQLEDLSFPHLYPKEYEWLTKQIGKAYREREAYIEKVLPIVRAYLVEEGVEPVELHARPKHHWSLYQKLLKRDMELGAIYDLMAIRILVRDIEECYKALGAVHKHFTPLPGRIKDYIALPKGSGYQSLHTTVFCVDGRITEFQIRTPEMHWQAEFGIAAHWQYKEAKGGKAKARKSSSGKSGKLQWIEQIQEWQKYAKGTKEFIDALKLDFLGRRIFVFTPKGDITDLPAGATAVDFAYAIHSEIGHRCAGAKADGRMIPLSQALENGMLVEIMTRKDPQPNRDWLQSVKTSEARKKIMAWFRKYDAERESAIAPKAQESADAASGARHEAPMQAGDIAIKAPRARGGAVTIEAAGMRGVLTRLAKCCAPLPGDAIEGYVTLHDGIAIHKAACPSLKKTRDPARRIPVSWQSGKDAAHPATIRIRSRTRVGMLRDVSEVISKAGFNILSLTAFDTPDGEAVQIITVEVRNTEELEWLSGRIKAIKDIFSVERV
ncbi:MAG: bifunctional (p)ppGpp synthetase/guanosine-3',5'-bis(diphosphate) 3'-pyrophosphohydrolase [bacterium]|nr:bifunctional (p)ppGpp synthetase/guanosine-3',5'-bis(diphosphate) 3'-pyrophosphohydrolase [bacterium]